MAKPAIVFVCADCGAETLQWQGQCPQCSQWNTLEQRTATRRPGAPTVASAPPIELADLGSTNGVYVNGHRMGKKVLVTGDIMRVGNTEMVFRVE